VSSSTHAGSTAAVAPADGKAAAAFTKAASKLRGLVTAKCSDTAVAALGLCAATAAGLGDCLLATHHQAIVDALAHQYGNLEPSADPDVRKCQAAIGKNVAGYLSAYLKASAKCLDQRNKSATPGDGAELCIGAVSGSFVPPTDARVAEALLKATGKLSAKVSSACSEDGVAALDACAGNKADLIDCLVCSQRRLAFDLLGSQYGGN